MTLKSLLVKALAVAALCAVGWVCWKAMQQGDYFAAGAALFVAAGALLGFWRGIVGSIISLVGFIAAYLTAPKLGAAYESLASEHLGTTGILNRGLAIGIAALAAFFVFRIVSSLVWKLAAGKSSGEKSIIDRLLGLVGGAAQSTFCVLLFVAGFALIKPALPTAEEAPKDATAVHKVLALSDAIDQSQIKPWADKYIPLGKVPQFNQITDLQQSISRLDGPDRVKYLMKHPSVMELRKDPEMTKAVGGLVSEPEIVELMTGKRAFDKSAVSTLLQSDAVLKLIEQPGFLETATSVLAETATDSSTQPATDPPTTRTRYTSQ